MLRNWIVRLRALFRREAVEAEFDEELRYHLEREVERNVSRGLSPDEAYRAARRAFGDPGRLKEEARETWCWSRLDELLQDLRYAARVLRRDTGYTMVAVLSLGFGIGAMSTLFGVVDALDLRRLPYRDAERLVWPTRLDDRYCPGCPTGTSLATAAAWADRSDSYDAFAFWSRRDVYSRDGDVVDSSPVRYVTPGFFDFLGVRPLFGRDFVPADSVPGAEPVVILSHEAWQSRFGGDVAVLGQRVELFEDLALSEARTFTVVGVLRRGFRFGREVPFWVPLSSAGRASRFGYPVARLRPGVTRASAEAELQVVAEHLAVTEPSDSEGSGVAVRPLRDRLSMGVSDGRMVLFGVTSLVLLIAVLNVTGLSLARAVSRQGELTVRSALGAGRLRLVRQLLVEGTLLGVAAGAFGTLLTVWGVRAARAWFRFDRSGLALEIDARFLGFTAGLSILVGVLTALLPSLRAARADLHPAFQGRRGSASRPRRRGASGFLLTAQISAALVLLTGAGLLGSEFVKLRYLDIGFDPKGLYDVGLYGSPDLREEPEALRPTIEEARNRAAAVPGVASVALQHRSALAPAVVRPDSWADAPALDERTPRVQAVDPAWFEAFRTPILAGRGLTAADTKGERAVVVVNVAAAVRFWPGQSPLGRQVFAGDSAGTGEWLTVVGVAADVERGQMVERHWPILYRPLEQAPIYHPAAELYVRLSDDAPGGTLPALQTAVQEALGRPAPSFQSTGGDLDDRLRAQRLNAMALNLFAVFALLLAAMGVYGSVAYAVVRQTREIGIRVALGAERRSVLGLVARHATLVAVGGVVLGLAGSLALTRLLGAFMSATSPTNPWVFGISALFVVGVALVATYIPARRATAVDPMIALRSE